MTAPEWESHVGRKNTSMTKQAHRRQSTDKAKKVANLFFQSILNCFETKINHKNLWLKSQSHYGDNDGVSGGKTESINVL